MKKTLAMTFEKIDSSYAPAVQVSERDRILDGATRTSVWPWLIALPLAVGITTLLFWPFCVMFAAWPNYVRLASQRRPAIVEVAVIPAEALPFKRN